MSSGVNNVLGFSGIIFPNTNQVFHYGYGLSSVSGSSITGTFGNRVE
jgi:hypothetical protein